MSDSLALKRNPPLLQSRGASHLRRAQPAAHRCERGQRDSERVRRKIDIGGDFVLGGFSGARWEKRNSSASLYLVQTKLGFHERPIDPMMMTIALAELTTTSSPPSAS